MPTVRVFNAHERYRISRRKTEAYVRSALGRRKADVSVVYVDGRYCKAINKRYLNHNTETDVISFTIEREPVLEGEIYVNLDRTAVQAREYGVSVENEIARLVIHGTLHLLGHDDKTNIQRKRMRALEDRYLRRLLPFSQGKKV